MPDGLHIVTSERVTGMAIDVKKTLKY